MTSLASWLVQVLRLMVELPPVADLSPELPEEDLAEMSEPA